MERDCSMTSSFVCTSKMFSCQVGITFSCVTTSSLLERLVLYVSGFGAKVSLYMDGN